MENYEFLSTIGTGSFGSVSKIRRKSDGKVLVWKEINYGAMSSKEKKQLVSEVNILRELRHPHIVRYYDRVIDKPSAKIYIVMEFCEGGDMAAVIKRCRRDHENIPEDVIWKLLMQISLALYECHKKREGKILHRDLKPANIFLDANMNAKLGDFGLSRIMGNESVFAYTRVGTPYYMSPEQITEEKYDEKSDIWSLGCLFYEIASLRAPFQATTHKELARKIKENSVSCLPSAYSNELQRVIVWMMSQNPEQRPSVEDLLNLPEVSLRIREKRLRENHEIIRQKTEELKKREAEVQRLEEENAKFEMELNRREALLSAQNP